MTPPPNPDRAPDQEELAELARTLDLAAFTRRIYQDVRGSLPSSSIPTGSPSAERPRPRLDQEDVRLLNLLAAYQLAYSVGLAAMTVGRVSKALHNLRQCRTFETAVLPERYRTPEQLAEHRRALQREADAEQSPTGITCANPNCTHLILGGRNDPRLRGLCRRCYRFIIKHGYHRTPDLCARDIERHPPAEQAS